MAKVTESLTKNLDGMKYVLNRAETTAKAVKDGMIDYEEGKLVLLGMLQLLYDMGYIVHVLDFRDEVYKQYDIALKRPSESK